MVTTKTVGDRLTVKREFANQDDVRSQKRFELLNAVNRSHSEFFSDAFFAALRAWVSAILIVEIM